MTFISIHETLENGFSYRTDLKDMIRYINTFSNSRELLLVEIGSYMGASTFFLAKNFKHVISIDPYRIPIEQCGAEYEFIKNLCFFNNVSKIRMASEDAVGLFADNSIDIVYIDGNHNREYITKDIKLWIPKIKEDGFISGHDYYRSSDITDEDRKNLVFVGDVFEVVNEMLGEPEFKDIYSNWLFRKETLKHKRL